MNVEDNGIVLKFSTDMGNTSRAINSLSKNLENLQKALAGFSDDAAKKLDDISRSIERIGKSTINIKGLTSELKKLSNVKLDKVVKQADDMKKGLSAKLPEITPTNGNASEQLSELPPVLKLLQNAGNMAGKGLTKVRDALLGLGKAGIDRLKSRITGLGKSFNGFLSSIGRIAMYRLIRSGIKMVTDGFQEGMKNAYLWAKEVGNQFAASMDMIKTSTLYLKNSLGAMVAPLINQIAPVIDVIIDRFVDLLNIINQVFALLGGQSTYFKALKYPAEYMEDTAGATSKARKELELWLASFDELNIIPNQKDTGRGSGAGTNLDYGSMFEEAPIMNPLRDAIENGDWEGLGRLIADKVNGMIENADFGGVGTAIGKRIGALVDVTYGFMSQMDFSKLGKKFGEMVTNAINNINWKNVGKLSVRKWTALIDLVVGFLGKLDWGKVGKAFGDYIRGKLEELSTWIAKIDWKQAGTDLVDKLVEFFNGLDLNSVFTHLGELISNAAGALKSVLGGILERLWEYIQYWIYTKNPKLAEILGINGEELAKKFGDGIAKGKDKVEQDTITVFGTTIRTIQNKKPELITEAQALGTDLSNGITRKLPDMNNKLNSELNTATKRLNDFSGAVDGIFGRTRTMTLAVDVGRVTVPKFSVEQDNVSGINFPVINARKYNIPMAYASGGFPEDGLFFANHSELVGRFANGRTAVANNEQIIEGIKRGVMEGFAETGNGNTGDIYLRAEVDGRTLFEAVCDRTVEFVRQTGRNPLMI